MQYKKLLTLVEDVNVMLCDKDKQALYRYASKVSSNGLIVDIGTAAGGSAFIMALASKPGVSVITIDPGVNPNFITKRKELHLEDKILFLNATSGDAFKDWDGEKIDMLFIDGIHNYDGVMDDFNTFGSLVKKGGIVAIHDIFSYDNTIGTAVKELVSTNKIKPIEIIDDIFKKTETRIGMEIAIKL